MLFQLNSIIVDMRFTYMQMFVSDTNILQGSSTSSPDSDPPAQYLKLDPITTGGPKHTRLNDLKRILRISKGGPKSRVLVDLEELKRFKASLKEASAKASNGSKMLDESVHKLNTCWEAINSKKQFQNEGLPNEKIANQNPGDRPKEIIPNTHIGASAAEIQAEGQNNSFGRQPLAIGKDRDHIKDVGKVCDGVQEKIQRLPVSEETWDRQMKRKHSMGTVLAGSTDGEGEPKRVKYLKQANESGLQSNDAIGLRFDFDDHGKNYTGGIYPHTKGKASRAPQTGNLIVGNSSPETLDAWEQPSNVNQRHSLIGAINHKRPIPVESSISHLSQWVGQRPQKISRTRRANGASPPVYNCDEMPMPFEDYSPSSGTIMTPTTTRNMKPSSLKNASRSRRPRKKKSQNSSKAIAHVGHPSTTALPDIAGRSGDDCELFAANFASNASYTGCFNSFQKKMEPNFAPVNLEVTDHLKQQNGVVLTDNLFSQYPLEGERGRNILNQSDSKELPSMVDMVDQPHDGTFLSSQMDLEYKLPPLYQRVLTALIMDDQTEETFGDENISFLHERDDPSVGFYTDTVSCNGNATFTCDKMFMEDKLLTELQSVGIYPEPVPELADGSCEVIDQVITQLQKGSCQQATRGTIAAKYGISKASRPVPLVFKKRTLARCRTFEETRKSSFLDPMFKDVLFATPALDNHTFSTFDDIRPLAQNSRQDFAPSDSLPSREQNVMGNSNHPSNLDFTWTGPILNGGKKGNVLPDDVGASAYMGEKKGKVLLDDVGASASLGGEKEKVLLDDVGASASLGGKKGEVLLDDIGANASLVGKKGEVLFDDVDASASLGGKKGEVLLEGVGASASLGGKRGEVLLDVGANASLGGKKGEVLLDDVDASASLGGKKGEVLLEGVGASAPLGGKRGEVLLDVVGVDASASSEGKKGEVLLGSASLGGKKGEVLLEDVGASATLANSFLGGTTRKRSKRGTNKDTSMRNHVKRGGRSSASNTRSERKTKVKAKPKTDQLSTSAKGSLGKLVENTDSKPYLACGSDQLVSGGNNNVGSVSQDYSTNNLAVETEDPLDLTNMPELDSIEFGADKDLDSWLNIDVDALEDDDNAVGLDTPMDDLFTVL
ncbi:hypothetical protein RYX36_021606 [Vicia faba]